MIILRKILLSLMILISFGCDAQINRNDIIISKIRDFYTAHAKIWSIPSTKILPNDFYRKLDSLNKEYCTPKLREEAKKSLKDGFDLLTDDWGISEESIASLTVERSSKENIYIVSYILESTPISPDKPVKRKVSLKLTIVKVAEKYKIASVN